MKPTHPFALAMKPLLEAAKRDERLSCLDVRARSIALELARTTALGVNAAAFVAEAAVTLAKTEALQAEVDRLKDEIGHLPRHTIDFIDAGGTIRSDAYVWWADIEALLHEHKEKKE